VHDFIMSMIGDTMAMGDPYLRVIGSSELFNTGQNFRPSTLTNVRATLNHMEFAFSNSSSICTLLVRQYGNCTCIIS